MFPPGGFNDSYIHETAPLCTTVECPTFPPCLSITALLYVIITAVVANPLHVLCWPHFKSIDLYGQCSEYSLPNRRGVDA